MVLGLVVVVVCWRARSAAYVPKTAEAVMRGRGTEEDLRRMAGIVRATLSVGVLAGALVTILGIASVVIGLS